MKRFIALGGMIALSSSFLSGCTFGASSPEVTVVDDPRPVKERILDFEAYKEIKNAPIAGGNAAGIESCSKFADFESRVSSGEVDQLVLYAKGESRLDVYKTPNYEGFTNPMISDYNTKCIQDPGVPKILMAMPEVLIWGNPSCSGATPGPEEEGYQEFVDCQLVAESLQEYLQS